MALIVNPSDGAPSFRVGAGSAADFRANPAGTIEQWRNVVNEDACSGRQIEAFRVLTLLKGLSQKDRNAVAKYLRENYHIQLEIPEGKINLAHERDELAEGVLDSYSVRHLIVLLYSTRAARAGGTPVRRSHVDDEVEDKSGKQLSDENIWIKESIGLITALPDREVFRGEGVGRIRFGYFQEQIDPARYGDKIGNIFGLVTTFNRFIPQHPLRDVIIDLKESGHYWPDSHTIRVNPDSPHYMETATHEMAHALFHVVMERPVIEGTAKGSMIKMAAESDWQKIYLLSLANRNYEIVDDSNYSVDVSDSYGHPFDNANELFGSSVSAFVMHSERFSQFLSDPNTPENMRQLGTLIYCYLRDRVFHGVFNNGIFYPAGSSGYEANNLVKEMDWDTAKSTILDVSDVAGCVESALRDDDRRIRIAARRAIE